MWARKLWQHLRKNGPQCTFSRLPPSQTHEKKKKRERERERERGREGERERGEGGVDKGACHG